MIGSEIIGLLDYVEFYIYGSWCCCGSIGTNGLTIGHPDLKLVHFEVWCEIVHNRAIKNDLTITSGLN